MKIEWRDIGDGRWGLQPALESARDASPPLEGLYFDHEPRSVQDEDLAVAAALVFSRYCHDSFSGPGPLTYEAAQVIAQRHAHGMMRVFGVAERLKSLPLQPAGRLHIQYEIPDGLSSRTAHADVTLALLDSGWFAGKLMAGSTLAVASNATLWRSLQGSALAAVAAGVLFARDLSCSIIAAPQGISDRDARYARGLLASIGLRLEGTP